MPQLFSLSLVKAAQKSMALTMAELYEDKGVHIGLVNVQGAVSELDPKLNPDNIAKATWELFDQVKGHWTREVVVG